jgi:hypothetical protein
MGWVLISVGGFIAAGFVVFLVWWSASGSSGIEATTVGAVGLALWLGLTLGSGYALLHRSPAAKRGVLAIVGVLAIGTLSAVVLSVVTPPNAARRAADERAARTAAEQRAGTATPASATAEVLDPRRIAADLQTYAGHNVQVQGRAVNVRQQANYTWLQLSAQAPRPASPEPIVVELRPKAPDVLRDECYRIFGTVAGTRSEGAPLIRAYAYEPTACNP